MAEQRYVLSARIVGSVHRDTPKLKMFMVSVLWSDEAEVIIYRSFKDFKKFHGDLKKQFPNLNPFKKTDRLLPKFRGKARRSSLPQKGSKKSVKRMKFLESYCEKLMKCEPNVTQSSTVTRFFNPKDQDVQTDFTKNSVVVLLSDDVSGGVAGAATIQHAGNVTHPFVTQTYRSVAPYEAKDTKNRPFKVAKDEKLDVLIKDPTGWWLVEREDKRLAWFPAPYLELWEGEEEEDCTDDIIPHGGALYCAVRTYNTTKTDELSVSIGSVVEVLRKSDNGWWLIRFNGKAGYIPSMYLQPYNNPRAGVYGLQKKLHSSTLNLATTRSSQSSYSPVAGEPAGPEDVFPSPSRLEAGAVGHLHKARSLDVLSEPWKQPRMSRPAPDAAAEADLRRMSNISAETSFSDFSLSSDDSRSPSASDRPSLRSASSRSFNSSTESAESAGSAGQATAAATPRVPPRPKTEEILTRCTTLTRKAALATKTRLQVPSDGVHGR